MTRSPRGASLRLASRRSVIVSILVVGIVSATASAADLSKYRDFQLGTDLASIAKQTGASLSEVKVIHSRPALIQELEWRPQPLGAKSHSEPAKEVVFSFCDGELFKIAVYYDRYETEGMTTDDIVDAIATNYGTASKPAAAATAEGPYADQETVVAQWQDQQYRFQLIRSSYGPVFQLTGVLKKLEAAAQAAILEATRLDNQEAPQRAAAQVALEVEAEKAKLDQARLVNKAKFRP
ncbi:MAG TPA: hypothetical protein VGP62_12775 [Bryobacteraceae bacterium]|nr:hypothetical protein [Bryobacteraceae bacterium]